MKELQNKCAELVLSFKKLESDLRESVAGLRDCETYFSRCPALHLLQKIITLNKWIDKEVDRLMQKNNNEGYVYIILSPSQGVCPSWFKDEMTPKSISFFEKDRMVVMTKQEFEIQLATLFNELSADNRSPIIEWMHRWGKSPGLDFDRYTFDFSKIDLMAAQDKK